MNPSISDYELLYSALREAMADLETAAERAVYEAEKNCLRENASKARDAFLLATPPEDLND